MSPKSEAIWKGKDCLPTNFFSPFLLWVCLGKKIFEPKKKPGRLFALSSHPNGQLGRQVWCFLPNPSHHPPFPYHTVTTRGLRSHDAKDGVDFDNFLRFSLEMVECRGSQMWDRCCWWQPENPAKSTTWDGKKKPWKIIWDKVLNQRFLNHLQHLSPNTKQTGSGKSLIELDHTKKNVTKNC